MFEDRDEIAFYAISGLAFSIAFWSFGLFSLKGFPVAAALLFACFSVNLLLTHFGQMMLGKSSEETVVKTVFVCAGAAFFLAWLANLGKSVPSSFAVPGAVMFLLPSILYYVRQAYLRSEADVPA